MSKKQDIALRLLLVDDRVEDAEATASTLRNAGIAVRPLRADNPAELASLLSAQPVDLVVAARTATTVPFAEVLQQVGGSGKDVPIIALAEELTEADYVAALDGGARTVALRGQPALLLEQIRDQWSALESRRAQRRLEARLRETERRCDALIDSSRDPIAYIHEGMHIRANPAYLEMFGYESFDDVEGMSILDMVAPQHVDDFKQLLKSLAKGDPPPPRYELEARDIEGSAFPAAMEFTSAQYEGEPCLQVVFRRQEIDPELVQELEELRQRDQVTGLFNRPTFLRALEDAVDEAGEKDARHGLLMIAPDHYQRLLQDIGLDSADALLAAIGERLRGLVGEDAVPARFSEQTFAVLLRNGQFEATVALAERIRDGFASHVFQVGRHSSAITLSIGGVEIGEKVANVAQVLAVANDRMESSANVGGNRSEVFDPSAVDRAEEERTRAWVARLRDALDNDRFLLHYQPVVNLQGDNAAVYEALLRLDGGDGETIMPSSFLGIAKEHGLLGDIDRYVVAHAIEVIGKRLRENRPTTLMIKVSQTALEDSRLAGQIGESLREHGVPGEYLVLQLSEAKVFTNIKAAQDFATAIGAYDCRLCLEQFGVGLDPFQLLAHLKPHLLKIDRSFIEELARNPDSQERVREITHRARDLGIRTVAEFVQDAASMSILFSIGVDYVQGNFLAAPGPVMAYDFE